LVELDGEQVVGVVVKTDRLERRVFTRGGWPRPDPDWRRT